MAAHCKKYLRTSHNKHYFFYEININSNIAILEILRGKTLNVLLHIIIEKISKPYESNHLNIATKNLFCLNIYKDLYSSNYF